MRTQVGVLTLPQAATAAKLSYPMALRLVMRGIWKGWQDAGRWYVDAASVERWQARSPSREIRTAEAH